MNKQDQLAAQVLRVANKLIFLEKRIVFQHGALKLHPSELHLLRLVLEQPELNSTGLAQGLGVTKGAVSQTVTRLDKKGVLVKERLPGGNLATVLTPLGHEAMQAFVARRQEVEADFARALADLDPSDRRVIADFLDQVEAFVSTLD